MDGHGRRMINFPPTLGPTSFPFPSTIMASTPKKGRVALPGLVGIAPGKGVIMIAPVSVCHQVSTTGQRPPPIFSRYHIQASGLIGSPTDPSSRSDERSCLFSHWSPQRMNARIAVGAVLLNYAPKPIGLRPIWGAFVH